MRALTALRRVLVADDDATVRRMLCILLDLKEYGLLVAQDGPAALDVARSERPDVAILGLTTSGQDGVDVCRALRADADAYLAKPYSPLALLDVVQRLSRGKVPAWIQRLDT